MRAQRISATVYGNNTINKKNDIAFTSDQISLDLGASSPRGNGRVQYMDKKGNILFSYKSNLNYNADKFKGNDDFNGKMAEFLDPETTMTRELSKKKNQFLDTSIPEGTRAKLDKEIKELENNLEILAKRTPKQKKLGGVALFLPGTMQGKRALIIPNLKDEADNSLVDVDLTGIVSKLEENGKVKLERSFDIQKNFIPLKDLAATGVIIAKKVMDHPELSKRFTKGFCMSVVHPGGGWGATTVEILDDNLLMLRTSESGHDVCHDFKTQKPIRLGAMGASVPSVIENFALNAGITDPAELKAVKGTGMAHMVTQKQIDLSTIGHKGAIEALLKTDVYELVNSGSEITTLRVKDIERFERASRAASKSFADAVGQFAISRITRGFNALVVSGPLAMGLDAKLKEKPINIKTKDTAGNEIRVDVNSMEDAIWARINKYTSTDNTVKLYVKEKNFQIICDKAVSAIDNNEGGAFFLSGETKTVAKRGELVTIPKDVLNNLSKYTDPSFVDLIKRPLRNLLRNILNKL